ncbi:MAG: NAD(P)H-hydrate epimerase [Planctomycetaceae bacterium]
MSPITMNRELSRQIDADAVGELGIPSLLLMENAARGAVDRLLPHCSPDSRIQILAGPGNNGGDGLAMARQLAAIGREPRIAHIPADRRLTADNEANMLFLHNSGLPVIEIREPEQLTPLLADLRPEDWIIDCLLGTGIHGAPRSPFAEIISAANESSARIFAIDIPSGLDCDTGAADGVCIRATMTVTFVSMKQGFCVPSAAEFTGQVVVEHIGIPQTWISAWYQKALASHSP